MERRILRKKQKLNRAETNFFTTLNQEMLVTVCIGAILPFRGTLFCSWSGGGVGEGGSARFSCRVSLPELEELYVTDSQRGRDA